MSIRFDRALVRPPAANFAEGLTSAGLGAPDVARALDQHAEYCRALERCGLALTRLEPDPRHPDSTFVEDTALVVGHRALLTRPGAASRAGEVDAIAPALARDLGRAPLARIVAPGTLDAGDLCETDGLLLAGRSERTNDEGLRQLAAWLGPAGVAVAVIDIREVPGILHLKSGLSWLGEGRLAVIEALAGHPALAGFGRVRLPPSEAYGANCVRVNDRILIAAGNPRFQAELGALGYRVEALEMSEFRKMDGGLTCLSLRLPPAAAARPRPRDRARRR